MYRSDTKEQKGAHLRGVHISFPDGGERTFSIVKHRGGGPMLASQMAWMDDDTELYYGMGDVVGRADSSDNLNATGEFLVLGWLVGHACYNSPGDTRRWLRPEDRANPERGGKMRATALMIRILSIEHSGKTPLLTSPVTGTSYLGFQLELADKSLFGPGPGMFSYRCGWKTQFTQASLFDVAMNWWDSFTSAYTSSQINLQPSQDSRSTIGEEHYASKHLWHMYKGIPSSALRLYSASAKWDAKRGATDSSSTHSQRAGKSINGKSNKRSNNAPPSTSAPKKARKAKKDEADDDDEADAEDKEAKRQIELDTHKEMVSDMGDMLKNLLAQNTQIMARLANTEAMLAKNEAILTELQQHVRVLPNQLTLAVRSAMNSLLVELTSSVKGVAATHLEAVRALHFTCSNSSLMQATQTSIAALMRFFRVSPTVSTPPRGDLGQGRRGEGAVGGFRAVLYQTLLPLTTGVAALQAQLSVLSSAPPYLSDMEEQGLVEEDGGGRTSAPPPLGKKRKKIVKTLTTFK